MEPCYQWAQNMTHILIRFKFARKWDIPGILETNRLNVTITMPELYLSCYGFTEGEKPIKFSLKIRTYKFMNPPGSIWKQVEMGKIQMEILKSPSPYVWRNIYADADYNPPNQMIWWDMYKRYQKEMEAGFGILEQTERQREDMDEIKQIKEERLIEDRRYIKKTLPLINNLFQQNLKQQQECYKLPNPENTQNIEYGKDDPFEWYTWIL